jgi:hypothetical protein
MHHGHCAEDVHLSQDLKDNRYLIAKLQPSLACPCTTPNYRQDSSVFVLQCLLPCYFLHKVSIEEIMSACEIKSEEI